jgi:hypothetical protein
MYATYDEARRAAAVLSQELQRGVGVWLAGPSRFIIDPYQEGDDEREGFYAKVCVTL